MCTHQKDINAIRVAMSGRYGLSAGDRGPIERALDSIERGECGPHESPSILHEIAQDLGINLPLQGGSGAF